MANRGLWDSSAETSRRLFLEAALQVAESGEMYQLKPQLSKMQPHDSQRLFDNARLLDPGSPDAGPAELKAGGIRYMGAGYSKIYAMMLDEFSIYDSTVGWRVIDASGVALLGRLQEAEPDRFSRAHLRTLQRRAQKLGGIMASKLVYAASEATPPDYDGMPEIALVGGGHQVLTVR